MKNLASLVLAAAAMHLMLADTLHAQGVDSCLTTQFRYYMNPDSVKIDTCSGSSTYQQFYATHDFQLTFEVYAISLPPVPEDSLVEVDWRVISTSYPTIRSGFQALEDRFGTMKLRKRFPADTGAHLTSRIYYLRFINYVPIYSVAESLLAIDSIRSAFYSSRLQTSSGSAPTDIAQQMTGLSVYPNPSRGVVTIQHDSERDAREIMIMDVHGKVVEHKVAMSSDRVITLDISHLASGKYLIRSGNRQQVITLIR